MTDPASLTRPLTPAQADSVLSLASAAQEADGVAPLSEQTMLHVRHGSGSSGFDWVVGSPHDGGLAGYAHLDAPDPSEPDLPGELVVHPAHRRQGVGTTLVAAMASAAASAGAQGIRVWAHGDRPGSAEFAKATGFTRARELLQMLLPARDASLPEVTLPDGVTLRGFMPGADEEEWLGVNRRAFAHHPEQGRMTRTDLEQREAEPWFDPAGFFLAIRSGKIAGFHWTKVHPSGGTDGGPIGEVYVVGVDPSGQGGGLGKALTIAGLAYLRDRGLAEIMLYVDGDNTPAVRLYEGLGFTRWHVDVMYARRADARLRAEYLAHSEDGVQFSAGQRAVAGGHRAEHFRVQFDLIESHVVVNTKVQLPGNRAHLRWPGTVLPALQVTTGHHSSA